MFDQCAVESSKNKQMMTSSSPSRRRTPPPPAQAPASAILPSGRVNVDLIQREVANDVALHDRYRAEDAMKKRAIHSSQNYDEFRNLVLASQLKPVNRSEMSQLFNPDPSNGGTKRVGGASINKAYNGGGSGSGGGGSGVSGKPFFTSPYALEESTDRGTTAGVTGSSQTKSAAAADGKGGGGGSLFDQSKPAELDGLNWNANSKSKSTKKKKKKSKGKKSAASAASSSTGMSPLQFEREWKRTCTDPASTARYLLRTRPVNNDDEQSSSIVSDQQRPLILSPEEASRTVFKIEICADILGDIVAALAYICRLSSMDDPKDDLAALCNGKEADVGNMVLKELRPSFVYRWMVGLSRGGRFSLNVSFLTEEQKEDVETIFASLDQQYERDGCYDEEDILKLRGMYK